MFVIFITFNKLFKKESCNRSAEGQKLLSKIGSAWPFNSGLVINIQQQIKL